MTRALCTPVDSLQGSTLSSSAVDRIGSAWSLLTSLSRLCKKRKKVKKSKKPDLVVSSVDFVHSIQTVLLVYSLSMVGTPEVRTLQESGKSSSIFLFAPEERQMIRNKFIKKDFSQEPR